MTWHATAITLFPDMFPGPLGHSLAGRALERDLWALRAVDLRGYATDRHRSVDDVPFGGGAGMVLRPDVLDRALRDAPADHRRIVLTPRGRRLTQSDVREFVASPGIVLLCGRYEGIDQRAIEAWDGEEISIGDFVLSGGEPAALALLDACVRLIPGVMGAADSALDESFSDGLLEYPQYTRPADWQGRLVPDVLLSGHHAEIAAWRHAQALEATRTRRPDLWAAHPASVAVPAAAP